MTKQFIEERISINLIENFIEDVSNTTISMQDLKNKFDEKIDGLIFHYGNKNILIKSTFEGIETYIVNNRIETDIEYKNRIEKENQIKNKDIETAKQLLNKHNIQIENL